LGAVGFKGIYIGFCWIKFCAPIGILANYCVEDEKWRWKKEDFI
jgi:hypothetical protein